MPTKKHKYSNKVLFFPRSSKDVLKDDPTESQNIIIPVEPEHFKYGVYFNDGYDYTRHLVSLEEFRDESIDLKELVSQREVNMIPVEPTRTITVIKEFQVDDEESDETAIEKLKQISNNQIDDDLLNCFNNEDELSDLEDNFVELADAVDEPPVITGDREIFNRFFQNEMEDDDSTEDINQQQADNLDIMDAFRESINDISANMNFDNNYNNTKRFNMPKDVRSHSTVLTKSFMCALERMQESEKRADFVQPVDKSLFFYQHLYTGETEFNEEEYNRAVAEWSFRKPKTNTSAFDVHIKKSAATPKLMTVEKDKKTNKRKSEAMDCSSTNDTSETEELVITDVSQFHVPRPKDETAEEKRERKKAIKAAKHCRREEKKVSKQAYKFARYN